MLPLLTLASAEICWQLEADIRMAALLEVVCLSLACLFQSIWEVGPAFAIVNEMFLTHTRRLSLWNLHAVWLLVAIMFFKMKSSTELQYWVKGRLIVPLGICLGCYSICSVKLHPPVHYLSLLIPCRVRRGWSLLWNHGEKENRRSISCTCLVQHINVRATASIYFCLSSGF